MGEADSMSMFVEGRLYGLLDGIIFLVITSLLAWLGGKLSRATIIGRFSLLVRLSLGVVAFTLIAVLANVWAVPSVWVTVVTGLAIIVYLSFSLRGITRLGILNAFATTTQGISAEKSLKLIKSDIAFLGIGANKLTSSREFSRALERCKREGGSARFLLSDPNNEGLMQLAGQNNRDDHAYKIRVKQSVREIFYHGKQTGVKFEVKLYSLDNEKSLSKFRIMFVDDRLCLLSHVVWNENEGSDNSQILLNKRKDSAEKTLFVAYKEFFDDLWDSEASRKVTEDVIREEFGD